MLFNSFEFVVLVGICMTLYYLPMFKKYQVPLLILASLVFYSFSNLPLLLLLLSSILINVLCSYRVVYGPLRNRKIYASMGVVLNLSILAFFKYSPLISSSLFTEENDFGKFLREIPLPIGISFFTFQGISLLIDTFSKEQVSQYSSMVPRLFGKHVLHTAFYISFFPQLVAGPIVKAHDFLPQIGTKFFKDIAWENCFRALTLGYFLKMVVADNLKDFTFWISFPYFTKKASFDLIVYLFGYSMQIFADFAGYSLIAIGIAGLFGYQLPKNFDFPYISTSFSEFWRRWHISLSSFLKEYLYIPLGGNRKGKFRTYINLMITMILGGLWHGAAWSYAIWGLFHGLALALERLTKDYIYTPKSMIWKLGKWIWVFTMVTFAWLLFKLPNFSEVLLFMDSVQNNWHIPYSIQEISFVLIYSSPVVLYHIFYLTQPFVSLNPQRVQRVVKRLEPLAFGCMLFLLFTNSGTTGEFIYFQF